MQPLFLYKNTKSDQRSFLIRHVQVPHLYNIWHYHRELELMYVIKSNGTRFVGDSIQPFFDGDLVLVGSNVPHFWQNDEKYFEAKEGLYGELILIQFLDDFLGEGLRLPEMQPIQRLFERAAHGLQIVGNTRQEAAAHLLSLACDNGKNKVLELLGLLDLLATSSDYRLLSSLGYQHQLPAQPSKRIQSVCEYLLQHYRQPIALAEVAKIANMSEKAFCRFFKKSTQKTMVQFITELRISHACKLLLSQEYPISQICFESGFNNLSNFNRVFKKITGQTPRAYQQAMLLPA